MTELQKSMKTTITPPIVIGLPLGQKFDNEEWSCQGPTKVSKSNSASLVEPSTLPAASLQSVLIADAILVEHYPRSARVDLRHVPIRNVRNDGEAN